MANKGNKKRGRVPNNFGEARRSYELTTETGKFTQSNAASCFGVPTSTYSDWEQGKTSNFDIRDLQKMAKLYGVTVDYLLQLSDSPTGNIAPRNVTANELTLLDSYRLLNKTGKKTLRDLARLMASDGDYGLKNARA